MTAKVLTLKVFHINTAYLIKLYKYFQWNINDNYDLSAWGGCKTISSVLFWLYKYYLATPGMWPRCRRCHAFFGKFLVTRTSSLAKGGAEASHQRRGFTPQKEA